MRTRFAALGLILAVTLLAACGGAEGEEQDEPAGTATTAAAGLASLTSTPQPPASPTARASPTATPSPTATASPTASPSATSMPAETVPTTCVFPSDTKSFHLTMEFGPSTTPDIDYGSLFGSLGGGRGGRASGGLLDLFGTLSEEATMEFSFVAPDRWSVVVSEGGHECCSYVVIGPQVWYNEAGSTDWTEQPASEDSFSFSPQDFCGVVEELPMSMELEGEETVNGIETVHYRLADDTSWYEWLVGEDESLDYTYNIWLAEDGNWPVKAVYDADCEIRWEISDLNEPSIVVEAPTLR